MLDKSVPYSGFYMRRKAGAPLEAFSLPEGFTFTFFEDGDDASWARIETSVLEFDSEFSALLHFKEEYMPHLDELRRRCIFVNDGGGARVATSTAWWQHVREERRPWVHWVAVDPRYQGLGLGKAIISRVVGLLLELEGDADMYLHTQTWSHKAVGLYRLHGFEPTDEKALYIDKKDNYKKTMRILKKIQGRNSKNAAK